MIWRRCWGAAGRPGPGPFRSNTFSTSRGSKEQRIQDPTIEKEIFVPLEDIAKGVDKKMKISRRVFDESTGQTRVEEKILTIKVKPGWKAGTKVTFGREGDQVPGKIPADIAFIIKDKTHPTFSRDGSNIIFVKKISLRQALCGAVVEIPLLNGGSFSIDCSNEVIKPTTVKRLAGKGLPFPKEPSRKGDLIVKFDIAFPDTMSQSSKDILYDVLGK